MELRTEKDVWDFVFRSFCQAYDCPARCYEDIPESYTTAVAEFDCQEYVRHLTDAAATRVLYCPEMSFVAGNVATFYDRWYVAVANASNTTATDHTAVTTTDGPSTRDGIVTRLEQRYFPRGGTGCSYARLHKLGLLTDEFMDAVEVFGGVTAAEQLLKENAHLEYKYDYMAVCTAAGVYMLRAADGLPLETLGEMFLRTAIHLHEGERDRVLRTFDDLINRRCMFATPIVANSGLCRSTNVSSCFLMGVPRMRETRDLFDTLNAMAACMENNGGVGVSMTHYNSRRHGGLIPFMKLINETVNMMKFGVSKRPGAVAVYLEPWHPDICDFVDARKNHGDERKRCRDLFTALWIPDLFMKRVHENGSWSLFDPEEEAGRELLPLYGADFENAYVRLEREGAYVACLNARMLWKKILNSQISTGTPYVLFKDSCIEKSVHRDLGPIRCSNLCTEVVQFSTSDEIATCKLASICLPAFLCESEGDDGDKKNADRCFQWSRLEDTVENLVFSLNRTHTRSMAIADEEKGSAAIGIGVQGLSDVFFALNTAWGSRLSIELNQEIFERIYYYALSASCRQARLSGETFRDFARTELADGVLQFDHWGVTPRLNWDQLRRDIMTYGTRNSLLVALMPTVTTSQLTGFNESFEPLISNVYVKRTRSGEYQVVNRYLVKLLRAKGRFDEDTMRRIQRDDGSVRTLDDILDEHERSVFRTAWEIPPEQIVDMAADRAPYVDQSQSMNLYLAEPFTDRLTKLLFYGWARGLKTGMYYLRTRPAAGAIKFTLQPTCGKGDAVVPIDCDSCTA